LSVAENQYNENVIRIMALIAAGTLLNFGLFFLFSIFTPVIVGLVSGFFFYRYRTGAFVGILSAAIAYFIIFIVTTSMTMDILAISLAVVIMSILGVIGGTLGVLLHLRTSS
jgi:hypothetical protein